MALQAANHFVLTGKGISAVVDPAGLAGRPSVSLEVDGYAIEGAKVEVTHRGIEVTAMVSATPDLATVYLRLLFPQVNLESGVATLAGVALLVTSRTSIGGPGLIDGPVHLYEVRPVGGTAEVVEF